MPLALIEQMRNRVNVAGQESDTALFLHLLYFGEMILKLTTLGLLAAVQEDRERHRYRHAYRLVRADSLGEWSSIIDDLLTGPTSQFLTQSARIEQRELTQGHKKARGNMIACRWSTGASAKLRMTMSWFRQKWTREDGLHCS